MSCSNLCAQLARENENLQYLYGTNMGHGIPPSALARKRALENAIVQQGCACSSWATWLGLGGGAKATKTRKPKSKKRSKSRRQERKTRVSFKTRDGRKVSFLSRTR